MERSKSGLFLRSRAQQAASSLLQRASDKLADSQPDLSNRLLNARERLQRGSERSTDILGRDVDKARARELKAASVYSEDHIVLFPGYACIKPDDKGEMEVVVEVSGFAYRTRPLERASRSQRLFVAAAQKLAGLSKAAEKGSLSEAATMDAEAIALGKGGAEVKQDAYEQLLALGSEAKATDDTELQSEDEIDDQAYLTDEPAALRDLPKEKPVSMSQLKLTSSSASLSSLSLPPKRASTHSSLSITSHSDDLRRMQANLKSRLRAFFAQKLEGRHVRIEIGPVEGTENGRILAQGTLLSNEGGGFHHLVAFPATTIQQGDTLSLTIELLANPHADAPSAEGEHQRTDSCLVQVARRNSVHIISDLDDTCKHSEVLSGARTLIRNVFARELTDLSVPGMQSWYDAMHERGAGAVFHYVSNSPWELAPVVKQFLHETGLPRGQIVLKQYSSGSGLMGNLWEPAGQRKRSNLEGVLKAFPDAPFVMIGDSGEQDLETYVSLAKQYPHQIKAIYIRDVTTPFALAEHAPKRDGSRTPRSAGPPVPTKLRSDDPADFARQGLLNISLDMYDEHSDALSPNNPPRPEVAGISDQKRKLLETFYHRVVQSERSLPHGVVFRLFQSGNEVKEESLALIHSLSS